MVLSILLLKTQQISASGSAVEHLLAKERVAGSIPVSRSQKLNSLFYLREWLSGGAPPCQGGGRGFDPRLALFFILRKALIILALRIFYFMQFESV